jgi:hypothetical protein
VVLRLAEPFELPASSLLLSLELTAWRLGVHRESDHHKCKWQRESAQLGGKVNEPPKIFFDSGDFPIEKYELFSWRPRY